MLSRSSFKTELETFRAGLYRPRKPGGIGNSNTADDNLLKHWIGDERAEEIWRALKKRRPDTEPASFIRTVLAASRSAQATVNRVYGSSWRNRRGQKFEVRGFKAEWAVFFPALKRHIRTLPDNLSPLDVAAIFDDAAQQVRDRHSFYFGSADHARFELSRKDEDDSRRLKVFVQIMGDYFFRQFGAPLHDHAVTLAEIVADRPLPRDFARNARRPTTTRVRAKKRRGGTFGSKKPS
jgi:hypothetical protein